MTRRGTASVPLRTISTYSAVFKARRSLIPPNHRAYLASHPLGFCIALGLAVSGLVNVLFPDAVQDTAASLALPPILYYAFSATWAVGGTCAALGLLRGLRNLEAGGDVLLASSLLVNYISVVWVRTTSALAAVFVLFMAVGFALRARHLTKAGYAVIAVPYEHDDSVR